MSHPAATASRSPRQAVKRPCGHTHHHGSCSACQRIQLARWDMQLAQVAPARRASGR